MWHLAVQYDQRQTRSKRGIQTWHRVAWVVTPIWKTKRYCLDTAESGRNFTQAFHTCGLKDAAGVTCIFHDTCTSQSRLLLFLFGERALRHLNLLLRFCSVVETMVPSGHRWTWSNKQRLVSQLWKKAWCDPEGLDVLGHAVWLFLLIRKPKTILKEQSWCRRYLRRNRDAYTTSPCPFTSTLSHPLKKSGAESRKNLLVKEKCAVGKGCNSECNPQLCCSVSLYEPFWAAAEVNWSWWKDSRWLPQPSGCNVWKGSGLTQPETGALTLLLAKWTEVGYVFKVPSFPAKTVDSALPNCGFDHGSPFTFHFFGLLGALAFRSMESSKLSYL